MEKYELLHNFKYDIIFRLRPDTIVNFDIEQYQIIDIASSKYIAIDSDIFACGSRNIMETYCNLVNKYGSNTLLYKTINNDDIYRWAFSPEIQLFSLLHDNKLLINYQNKSIKIKTNIIR